MANLTGKDIYLRFLIDSDASSLFDFHLRNRDFFQKYTPIRTEGFYTEAYQRNRIKESMVLQEADEQYMFGVFLFSSDELIGIVTLTEVVRGPLQAGWVGYYLDQAHNGRGYTTEAVRLVLSYAFSNLKLHRLEAGVMPHNAGSIKVLEKAGFHQEGLNKSNVRIDGKWQDHLHFAIINPTDE